MDAQRLGHQEVIVEQALLAHVWIFGERIVVADPCEHRLHARIILVQLGVGVAEHAGVADAAVAAKGGLAVFALFYAGHAFAREVDETALLLGVVARPWLLVMRGEVLAVLDELNCGTPV